jgi:sphinganine-1-phosphate aldolase
MFEFLKTLLNIGLEEFDKQLQNTRPHKIVLATLGMYFLYQKAPELAQAYRARHNLTYKQRVLDAAYALSKNLPMVEGMLHAKLEKSLESTLNKLNIQRAEMVLTTKMPEQGVPPLDILKEFGINPKDCSFDFASVSDKDSRRHPNVQQDDGKDSGTLYAVYPTELRELLQKVYDKTALMNPLHDKWPRITAMQAEVIHWFRDLFHGTKGDYGLISHGGTSSIIEAMAAYVLHARAMGISSPEIVVPETAHIAFKKAADLTGAKLIMVPVNKGAVSAATMRRYISSNTAVIVGSAPSFMYGIHDPIKDLGALAQECGVAFHVDACLGGFLEAFLEDEEPMDFRVPGVTSLSADLHKYGLCPKGSSIVLLRQGSPISLIHSALNWSGGLYSKLGWIDGSTSGARIGEIYTVTSYYGRQGFVNFAKNIIALRQHIQEQVAKLDGISIYGNPKSSVLGFYSNTLNSHLIADELEKYGWKVNLLQNPDGFHFCFTYVHTLIEGFAEQFIQDLKNAVSTASKYPKTQELPGNVKVYGTIGILPTEVQKLVCEQYQKALHTVGFFPKAKQMEPVENSNLLVNGIV